MQNTGDWYSRFSSLEIISAHIAMDTIIILKNMWKKRYYFRYIYQCGLKNTVQ